MLPNLLQIRSLMVNFHVLRDASGLYLLDAGFMGGRSPLRRELARAGWQREPIRGIVVTHGHLDHILNVGRIARETGAWVAAPRGDVAHYAGCPRYQGPSRITGIAEEIGRHILDFVASRPDRWIEDEEHLDIWGGLRAIHLPGHTAGHTGFYSAQHKLLFCGDLFASFKWGARLPPGIFNSVPQQIPAGIRRALALDLHGVIPNHGDRAAPEIHLKRLRKLAEGLG